jgi:sigma-B regulation protein RsbU (phosphoserine phosphatase)
MPAVDRLPPHILDHELAVARRVMADLLPRRTPELPGFEVAGRHETSHEVGGDYYEFIPLGDSRWGIAIADVVGKGVAAALLVAAVRASLFALVTHELAQRAILRRANRFFRDSVEAGKYVTLFYGVLDAPSRRFIYVNAGHPPPIVCRRNGDVELLEEGGMPLGLFDDPHYREGFSQVEPGDVLALYTDGLTEATSRAEEPYGLDRLIALLQRHRNEPADAICSHVVREVRAFAGPRPQDDQTLVVLKST